VLNFDHLKNPATLTGTETEKFAKPMPHWPTSFLLHPQRFAINAATPPTAFI
jgi:hypothetical protein